MDLEYNTARPDLVLPEHGRNVKKMVNYALSVEDKEERNKVVNAIIKVMGQLNPQLRDVEDYNHKLWDHLFILSDFKLDVDSPYPIPTKETFDTKPEKVSYPSGSIRYGHYGKSIQDMIDTIPQIEKEEDRKNAINTVANLMKRFYLTWNRDAVEDEVIIKQFNELAKGTVTITGDDIELLEHKDVQLRSSVTQRSSNRGRGKGKASSNRGRKNGSKSRNYRRR
ncbi:MAG: DUF4290 domain-containing protein [Flavobacteriales bacterium]|nr:DUF4290 domain-containing protein [Flavobacteriales bacterium]